MANLKLTINDICEAAHDNAKKKGFYKKKGNVLEKLVLIHSEVSEAVEDYRNGMMQTYEPTRHKPCGFPIELADIIIRVCDLAEYLKIDLNEAIIFKMEYNKTRPYKHGGKKA